MENKKYKLTRQTTTVEGATLYRIKALKDFSDVRKGDLGGFVKSEDNLSQEGNCWVYNKALVSDKALVCDDATVREAAWVCRGACIGESATVTGNSWVFGEALVAGTSVVGNNAWVSEQAIIYENAGVYENARVFGNSKVYGNAIIGGHSSVFDNSRIFGDVTLSGKAQVSRSSILFGNITITGDARIVEDNDQPNTPQRARDKSPKVLPSFSFNMRTVAPATPKYRILKDNERIRKGDQIYLPWSRGWGKAATSIGSIGKKVLELRESFCAGGYVPETVKRIRVRRPLTS